MTATSPTIYYIIAAIIVILAIVVVVALSRRAQSARLQRRFGPEYERVAHERGRTAAERELAEREARVKKFRLAELPPGARDRYAEEWRRVQARFVDEPAPALHQADELIVNVMRDRGYPQADFEQRAADLSPDHARALEDYRVAHDISVRADTGNASTEDLRQGMVHYRNLFDELVGTTERTRT